jgi:hypothetical protein
VRRPGSALKQRVRKSRRKSSGNHRQRAEQGATGIKPAERSLEHGYAQAVPDQIASHECRQGAIVGKVGAQQRSRRRDT